MIDDSNPRPNARRLDGLARVLEADHTARLARQEREERQLQAWQRKYTTEYNELLGARTVARLSDYAARNRRPEADLARERRLITPAQRLAERRRHKQDSIRAMGGVGVDRERLERLFDAAWRDFGQIVDHRPTPMDDDPYWFLGFLFEPVVLLYDFWPDPEPVPAPEFGTNLVPPYPGSWDRAAAAYQTGSSKNLKHDNWLWPEVARTGSRIHSKNWNAGEFEYMKAWRENGFFVPFSVPSDGLLKVQFDVACGLCEHCIETNDEYGWSSYNAWTRESAVVSAFWNLEDATPATETRNVSFVSGLQGNGDGESYPGKQNPHTSGTVRTITMSTDLSFPAGSNLWIYVGTEQSFSAAFHDVGVNILISSYWFVTGIRVGMV